MKLLNAFGLLLLAGLLCLLLGQTNQNNFGGSTVNLAAPGPIGGTTPSTGAFTALTCGVVGTGCVITGNGGTSGSATFTWPAVAGTSANGITISNNLLLPSGTGTLPSYSFTADPSKGLYYKSASQVFANGGDVFAVTSATGINIASGSWLGWAAASDPTAAADSTIARLAATIFGFGTAGNTTGKLKAAGYMSVGTTFTSSGGCTEGTLVGGATAGKFTTSGSTSCTTVVTMGNSATAPNGWQCSASDITTAGDAIDPHMTTSNATTATIATGVIVAGDVISFACIGY
jgi:hypothetical protein